VAASPPGAGVMFPWFIVLGILLSGESSTHIRHLAFEKNKGQAPADVRYVLRAQEYDLEFKRGELVFHIGSNALRVRFDGPLNKRVPEGHARVDGLVRYVDSEETSVDQNIPKFASIRYDSLYRGIDLICYAHGTKLECDFVALAGADPEHIRAFLDGADEVEIDDSGALVIRLPERELRLRRPYAFQLDHGQRTTVTVDYQINEVNEISFVIGPYNRAIPLIIDPK
jgi:hypothetical protein